MQSTSIRQAGADDVAILHALYTDWEAEGITGGFSADSEECIADRLGPCFLVAQADDQIVGFISASLQISANTGYFADGQEFVNIDDLYVRPQYRSGGIGARLMREITRIAEDNGIDRFALSSNTKDFERVVKFYRECGFETWNVTMFRQSTSR